MTLMIRWDASDTTYISGAAGERYVHFPVEVSATVESSANIQVTALDSANNIIAQQDYPGVPLTPEWVKFSPAILIADSSNPVTLKVFMYTTTVPISTPRLLTKTLGSVGTSSYLKYVFLAGIAFLLLGRKRR